MQMPADLRSAILKLCESLGTRRDLAVAAKSLSDSYRETERPAGKRVTEVQALAYAATRMPATYAALRMVLAEMPQGVAVDSVHDIGAGTGAAAWAVRETLGPAVSVTCEERDVSMAAVGKKLAGFAQWDQTPGPADMVILSYVLGEVGADSPAFVKRAWDSARKFLIIVEPGTTKGFHRIAALRDLGHIVAPCPHTLPCPMLTAGDWCHFAARVERTALHRQLKGGELSHEDEKFSYLILSKEPVERPFANRIVRHPFIEPGQIQLSLCTNAGTIFGAKIRKRSQPEDFKKARKAEWGDRWNPAVVPSP